MDIIKRTRKTFGKWVLIPITRYYLSKERKVTVGTIQLKIPPGVFHPTLFSSTLLLLEFTATQLIGGLKALELGAGSGLLSIAMAQKGANVTASDINPLACTAIKDNAQINSVNIDIVHSDLFAKLSGRLFDIILINPPYYPRDPKNDAEKAWFCGIDHLYFKNLFLQLAYFLTDTGYAMMVLSEDCHIDRIQQLAIEGNYRWELYATPKRKGEMYYLIKLSA
ncbi:methyltransferase [Spirosoma foliorum]|uniref:Methyltransferase n=1 Tax=Spirosoma foliorum TaxID=2710596 RepID=A0A7G5H625_9BACT|nr:methyltransferase [Spirosoma foliorum]QMW06567.1 methyltransferase [Spirosoma foliorum]